MLDYSQCMKNIPEQCIKIEQALQKRRISMNMTLKAAGLNWVTWGRWKSGRHKAPQERTWNALDSALQHLTGKTIKELTEEDRA